MFLKGLAEGLPVTIPLLQTELRIYVDAGDDDLI